ncbi:unnamed protein product [Caenorhabditis sp. 36 PRJEB53466]|nr:unnamed protein product [Caenorhabditis sp. 36 PRJEB53466]
MQKLGITKNIKEEPLPDTNIAQGQRQKPLTHQDLIPTGQRALQPGKKKQKEDNREWLKVKKNIKKEDSTSSLSKRTDTFDVAPTSASDYVGPPFAPTTSVLVQQQAGNPNIIATPVALRANTTRSNSQQSNIGTPQAKKRKTDKKCTSNSIFVILFSSECDPTKITAGMIVQYLSRLRIPLVNMDDVRPVGTNAHYFSALGWAATFESVNNHLTSLLHSVIAHDEYGRHSAEQNMINGGRPIWIWRAMDEHEKVTAEFYRIVHLEVEKTAPAAKYWFTPKGLIQEDVTGIRKFLTIGEICKPPFEHFAKCGYLQFNPNAKRLIRQTSHKFSIPFSFWKITKFET